MLREIVLETDFCVVGGGLAGVCATVAAARQGARVVLMQERPVLGGNASSEVRMWVCGAQGKNNRETGIIEEIMLESLYRNPTKNYYIWDSILLDFVRMEENITLLLNTACMDAKTEHGEFADGRKIRIASVRGYQMTTQTFYTVKASLFADCSGDSILAPLTGASFMYGREGAAEYGEATHVKEADSMVMGTSCLIQARETGRPVKFTPSERVPSITAEDAQNRPMNLYDSNENFWYLELGGTENTIDNAEKTKDKLLRLALGTWDYLKNSGNYRAENWDLDFLGFLPAKRESRRMKGEYVVRQTDISGDRIFPDTVAFGGWPQDDHEPMGYYHKGAPNSYVNTPAPYCLPYRALYSADVENLFFAGRNISMTHMAMSSIRVMATCALLGQAVGTAAAIAVRHGETPHGVYLGHLKELQQALLCADCFLPHFKREISPFCRAENLHGGDASLCNGEDRANRIYGNERAGVAVQNGQTVRYELPNPTHISAVHVVFDSDLDRLTLPGDRPEQTHATRCNIRLDSPDTCLPATLCRAFCLKVYGDEGEKTILTVKDNRHRAYDIPVGARVRAVALTVTDNWGGTEKTNILSFDFR